MSRPLAQLALAARLARRELRAGLKGFRIFLACLILGVGAIAAVGSVAGAFMSAIQDQSRSLLGGDVSAALTHREADSAEAAFLAARGRVSAIAEMRAMATDPRAEERTVIELKAVDGAYPLFGAIEASPAAPLAELLARDATGRHGAIADPLLLDRLSLKPGDIIRIGTIDLVLRAALVKEPDGASAGFSVGPRVLISREALAETGLVTLGSLIRYSYRVELPAADDAALDRFKEEAKAAFPDAAWRLSDRRGAAPGLRALIERIAVFLTFVGLTALIVGGVGVGNGVRAYLASKTETVATLKTLGADANLIFATYFLQVLAFTALGIVLGLIIGAAAPFGAAALLGDLLPIEISGALNLAALGQAALYGLLIAIIFTLWPLARTRDLKPAALFRDLAGPERRWPAPAFLIAIAAGALLHAGIAILLTRFQVFAAFFVLGAIAVFLLLQALGLLIMRAARKLPRVRRVSLRLAIANLYRPGAPTPAVVLSLGLGFTLLAGLALLDGNIRAQVAGELPRDLPAFFFIDIPKGEAERFDAIVKGTPGVTELNRVPNIRGRIIRVGEKPAGEVTPAPDVAWVLRGDQGLTFATEIPAGSKLAAGEWWPADYRGEPILSIYKDAAEGLGLKIGDSLTINVLGREITARIANTREIDWSYPGFNYVIVYAPGAIDGAPFMYVANVKADAAAEQALFKSVSAAYPSVSIIRSRDALAQITQLFDQLATGLRATSLIALIAGALVLAGAIAAGYRARVYDTVVLKVLGGTRGRLILTYAAEFAILGLVVGVCAAGLGTLLAYLIMTFVMQADFVLLPVALIGTLLSAALVTVMLGLAATWRALGEVPARVLRSL